MSDALSTQTVANRKAQAEAVRIRWRAEFMAAGHVEALREPAHGVKFQERLTYDPTRNP